MSATLTPTRTFRLIRKEDNPVVAHIIRTVMTEFGCVGEGYSINDAEVDSMFEAYTNDRSAFLVLEDAGKIVGCGGIGPLKGGEADTCELKKMYFLPEVRGFGFGKKMVLQCLAKAKELGYTKCYLETVARMEQANQLYQKLGFEKLDKPMGCTGHCSCDLQYVKTL